MPKWYIEANALMNYAWNRKDKTITANDIARFPKSDVQEVKHGHWVYTRYYVWICSRCKCNPTVGTGYVQGKGELFRFCPNCGTKMDEKE